MTELTKEKIAELRRLLEKATIGEWSVERHDHNDGEISYEIWELSARDMRFVCRFEEDSDDRGDASRKANFLLAMRNALPALLNLAERGIKCGQPDNPRGGDANARVQAGTDATSPRVTAGASEGEDAELCERLKVYSLAEGIMSSERRDLTEATARITSLSTQLAEARRERDDVRIEYGHMGDDYRELETKLRNTFADAQSMKRRVHAAEAEANALRERVGVLEEAMNAIGRLAYTQGDRTFDDAMRVLSWIDDEYRRARAALAGGDNA